MYFLEGLENSVARTKDQAKDGGWRRLVRRDGTIFNSLGDCLQYINTGR